MTGGQRRELARPRMVRIEGRVALRRADPVGASRFVARLRDLHAASTGVVWHASIGAGFDVAPLVHLPPPRPEPHQAVPDGHVPDGHAPDRAADDWRARHRPAMCYFRVGPDFIEVRDLRPAAGPVRLLLEDPPLIDTFTRCLRPYRLADLAPLSRQAAELLIGEGLLLRLGDWVTTLPNRMRRWPVPSQIV